MRARDEIYSVAKAKCMSFTDWGQSNSMARKENEARSPGRGRRPCVEAEQETLRRQRAWKRPRGFLKD